MSLSGFWSYVHADDDAEGGRIAQLGRDIAAQFELLTVESVELFLDRDSLEWGAQWRDRIETSLANVAFFIPVLTPRYFASAACRSELQTFARRAEQFGVKALLLPVLYTDLPTAEEEDELVDLARSFQWVDWRELRFSDRSESAYRRAIHELAERLVTANREAESQEVSDAVLETAEEFEPPGTLDVLAKYEEALPVLTATTNRITEEIARLGGAATALTPRLSEVPPGTTPFVWRLRVVRELSTAMADPADELSQLADTFAGSLHDMDAGIRTLIAAAPTEPENRTEFCAFFEQVRGLSASAEAGLTPLESLQENVTGLETLSREIRPVSREIRQGITRVVEGRQVMAEWVTLIEQLDFDCSPTATAVNNLEV